MGKCVEIEKDNKIYTLEFDRASIVEAENKGLDMTQFGTKPMSDFYLLVAASLYKHHSGMTSTEAKAFADFLLDEGYGMSDITETLVEMFTEAFHLEGKKKFVAMTKPTIMAVK